MFNELYHMRPEVDTWIIIILSSSMSMYPHDIKLIIGIRSEDRTPTASDFSFHCIVDDLIYLLMLEIRPIGWYTWLVPNLKRADRMKNTIHCDSFHMCFLKFYLRFKFIAWISEHLEFWVFSFIKTPYL